MIYKLNFTIENLKAVSMQKIKVPDETVRLFIVSTVSFDSAKYYNIYW